MRRAALAGGAALLLLSGCASGTSAAPQTPTARATSARANGTAFAAERESAGIPDCTVPSAAPAPAAEGLPDLVLPCLASDKSVNLSHLRGTPLVINVWAQWCQPCRQEAPFLTSFAARTKGRVRVIGIDHADPGVPGALQFARQSGWSYEQLADPDRALTARMAVVGIPVTLLVDADGRVVYRHTGAFASASELDALVAQHLGVS